MPQVSTIQQGIIRFVEHYEREYYRHDESRVSACRSTVHYLLHIAQNIRDCGLPQIYWQFPAERTCGILTQKVKSRSSANRNLSLAILRESQLQLLPVLYPSMTFTTSAADVETQLETRQETSGGPRGHGFHAVSALLYDVNSRQYSTDQYAQRGIALLHYHAIPPKMQPLSGVEKNRLARFLQDVYGGDVATTLRTQDLKVQKFSHCLAKFDMIRSRLCP